MHERREARAVGDVYDALLVAFPSVAPEIVEAAVRVAHGRLTGPVRDFVPLLVDRQARRLLRELDGGPSLPSTGAHHRWRDSGVTA